MPAIEQVLNLIAPHQCLVCRREGALLCAWCLPDAILPVPARCYKCQKLSTDSQTCKSCRRKSKLTHVWVRSAYDGLPKELVRQLKFQRARAAARPIASMLDETLPWLPPSVIVAHVPTATSRRRLRGYDQAELIAKEFAKNRKLKHVNLLARSGQSRQVGAKRAERVKQLAEAFRVSKPHFTKGTHVLIIDDIVTTGATIEAAANVLKQAGAKTVQAAAFAQKL